MKRISTFTIPGAIAFAIAMTGALTAGPAVAQQQWGQQQQMGQVPENAVQPEFLAQIQQGLQQQGYYRGQVDGLYGPLTHEALTQYQRDQGLQPTGQLNTQTVASMLEPQSQQAMAPQQQPMAAAPAEQPVPGFGAVEQMAEIPTRPGQIQQLRTENMSSPNIVGEAVPERPGTGAAAPQATRDELDQPQFRR